MRTSMSYVSNSRKKVLIAILHRYSWDTEEELGGKQHEK